MLEAETLGKAVVAFLCFSLLSSAVYILNDIRDAESDRNHEIKKNRPIASGGVSIPSAYAQCAILAVTAILLHVLVCGADVGSVSLLAAYFAVNVAYSMGLKNVPFVDISLLVSGFVIRVFYGAAVIGESVSHWVFLTVVSLSFYMGLGKRRNEILKTSGQAETRRVLRFYSLGFLDKFMYLCLSISVVFYALWSADGAAVERFRTDKLVWTVPLVILLVMKYSADIESDSYGDPVDVVTHDRFLMLLTLVYGIILLLLIYEPMALGMGGLS